MKIWNMIKKDFAVILRDRGALLWIFILPVVFIILFATLGARAVSEIGSETEGDNRKELVVVNQDENGNLSAQLLKELEASGNYRPVLVSLESAEQRLNKINIGLYLVIPEGFSDKLANGEKVTITIITHPNSSSETIEPVLKLIQGIAQDVSLELQLLDGLSRMGEMQSGNPDIQDAFNRERVIAQAKSQFEQARQEPLLTIRKRNPVEETKSETPGADLNQTFVPGMTVLFVFLASTTVARAFFEERKAGSLRRLLAAPITRVELLLGKILPVFLLTLVQIVVIFSVGAILLPLFNLGSLNIGSDPLAWAVTSIVIAICSTCLGLLLAAIAKTEGQITGLSNALLWVAGFLGGALIPIFVIQSFPFLNILSRFVPQTWATLAYYDVLARGKGIIDVLPYLGVLLAFSAVFFFVGITRIKFD